MIETPPDVTPEIEAALEQLGLRPRRIVLVSPLRESKGRRCAYRVEVDDGRTLKARQLDSPEEARRLMELRADLEEAFAPAVARYDCVLLEAWIEGIELNELDAEARAEDAGALLGRLHARTLGPDAPATLHARKWIERAMSDLEILAAAQKLVPHEAATLRAEILRRDPGTVRAALVHMDFCAENMLIDAGGQLRVIDNELLAIAPAGFDLGRTFDRWPMSEDAWARFCRGYRSSARAEVEAIGFWKILAALMGARVRFQRTPARLDAALALLRRFIEGEGLCDPP
jgi:Ser/Thr protein kinase RdoA (MazF antagonist)